MEKFVNDIVAALQRIGVQNVHEDEYSYQSFFVAECKYRVIRKRHGSDTFHMEGKQFRRKKDGSYDIGAAVALVLQVLPKKLQEKEENDRAEKIRKEERERQKKHYEEIGNINRSLEGTNMSIDPYADGFQLTIRLGDRATAMAAADYFQDGGFTSTVRPDSNEQRFYANNVRRIYALLTEEQQQDFIKELVGPTEQEELIDQE